jgi:uncharacterized protein YbjT (DUF2867 family)
MKYILIGGTGLVGSHLIQEFPKFFSKEDSLLVLIRNPQKKSVPDKTNNPVIGENGPNIEFLSIDFENPESFQKYLKNTQGIFCTLGTTIKKAGSKEAFRRVDYDYPLEFAKLGREESIPEFSIVTAMGSDPHSGIFYNRVKGELEIALSELGYPSLNIFQPSLILGERKEFRLGEELGKIATGLIPFSLLNLSAYAPIQAVDIARAMLWNTKNQNQKEPADQTASKNLKSSKANNSSTGINSAINTFPSDVIQWMADKSQNKDQ